MQRLLVLLLCNVSISWLHRKERRRHERCEWDSLSSGIVWIGPLCSLQALHDCLPWLPPLLVLLLVLHSWLQRWRRLR